LRETKKGAEREEKATKAARGNGGDYLRQRDTRARGMALIKQSK
jgi:hypothetical protein